MCNPATITGIMRNAPMMFLNNASNEMAMNKTEDPTVLASVDVNDAFLMVSQERVIRVELNSEGYVILKNLPGQRLGARAWYLHLHEFLSMPMNFEWCKKQPCIARSEHCAIVVHVDDILFCGSSSLWSKFV